MKKETKRGDENWLLYRLIPSGVSSFLWLALGRIISSNGNNESVLSNIVIYILAVLIFFVCFLLMCLRRRDDSDSDKKNKYLLPLGILIYIIAIVFIPLTILLEDKYVSVSQTGYTFRHVLWFPIYILLIFLIVNAVCRFISSDNTKSKKLRIGLIIVLSMIVTLLTYSPNPFGDLGGGLRHFDAYINSILNATKFIPYSYEVNSIYGHYGIFYIIPVKFFHVCFPLTKWEAISLSIALIGGITYTLFASGLSRWIHKDVVFILAAFAIGIWSLGFSRGNYYQGFPHRIFFQAVTLFSLMKLINKPFSKYRRIIVLLVAVASIVWNLEVGIVCTLVICACLFVIRFQGNVKFLYNIVLSIGELGGALLIAYFVVGLYNISVGGHFPSLIEYIYPIASQDYHVIDLLQLKLDIPVSLYFVYFIIFVGTFCVCGFRIFTRQSNTTILIAFLCAIMGMGVLTYYINRVCFANMQIATPMVVIILSLIVDTCPSLNVIGNLKNIENLRVIIGKAALYLLVILFSECIFNLGYIISFAKDSTYVRAPLQEFTDQIGNLPEGTDTIGIGASVFSTYISGSKAVYSMDWADMHTAGVEYWYTEVSKNDVKYLVVEESTWGMVSVMFPDAQIKNEFVYSDAHKHMKWYFVELSVH